MKAASNPIPFDNLRILDHKFGEIPLTKDIPISCEKYILPRSIVYSATGPPGIFLFQQIDYPEYSFWISHYFMSRRNKVTGIFPGPSLELHFILQNDLLYRLKGFDWQRLRETQYNLLSVPEINNEVYFDAKNYVTFDVHPRLPLLRGLAGAHSGLRDFLRRATRKRYEQYFAPNQYATPKMLYLIKTALEYLKDGGRPVKSLDDIVRGLIAQSVTNSGGHLKPPVNFFDVEKIYTAEKQLIRHMDDPDILEKQIRLSYIYPAKFREGFRQIFGTSPHWYLHRERMETARQLLESGSGFRIRDVAERVGYSNPNSFSTAYKKYFGSAPSTRLG